MSAHDSVVVQHFATLDYCAPCKCISVSSTPYPHSPAGLTTEVFGHLIRSENSTCALYQHSMRATSHQLHPDELLDLAQDRDVWWELVVDWFDLQTPEMQILLLTYLHSYLRGTQAICSSWLQPAKRCGITLDGMVEPPSKSAAFRSLGKSMVTAKDGLYYRCFFPSLELFLSKYWIEQNFVTNRLVYTSVTDNIDVFSSLIYVSDVL